MTRCSAAMRRASAGWPPNPTHDMRDELAALLAGADDELAARFDGRLQFGTAGLRAAVGAGPQRMNRLGRATGCRRASSSTCSTTEPDAATRGVIIGYDARRKSDVFALDTARVCAARGVRAMISRPTSCRRRCWRGTSPRSAPRPAWWSPRRTTRRPTTATRCTSATVRRSCRPHDTEIAACIDAVDPCDVPLSRARRSADRVARRLVRARPTSRPMPGRAPAPRARRGARSPTRRCTASAATPLLARVRPRRAARRRPSSPSSSSPTATFPTVAVPEPRGAGRDGPAARPWPPSPDAAIALRQRPRRRPAGRGDPARPTAAGVGCSGDEIGWLLADHILQPHARATIAW